MDYAQTEQTLQRFQNWLSQTQADIRQLDSAPAGAEKPVGLLRLIEETTALKQEVKLQTRGARGLEELVQSQLTSLNQALEQFRAVQPKEQQAAWNAGKSLATALADLDEAIDRGFDQIDRASRQLSAEADNATRSLIVGLDDQWKNQPFLCKLFGKSYRQAITSVVNTRRDSSRGESILAAIREGYRLIRDRLKRALGAERIAQIACIGQDVDPETMIVVEAIDSETANPGTVVAILRRGYTWNGKLLRSAEVSVAREKPLDEEKDGADAPVVTETHPVEQR